MKYQPQENKISKNFVTLFIILWKATFLSEKQNSEQPSSSAIDQNFS